MQQNIPAVIEVMRFVYDNIMYAELNTKSDYCHVCGYEGEIEIVKEDGKSRAIRVAGDDTPTVTAVPVLGTVTAGQPILAEQNYEGYVGYIGRVAAEDMFALRVRGESMIEVGIQDGDMIIAEKTCYAENGEIVVALIDNEATVKRFFRENGHYRLQPENSSMSPIIVDEVLILGKVVAIQRSYV